MAAGDFGQLMGSLMQLAGELKELEQALVAIEAVPERKIAALGVDDICATYCQIRPYVLTVVK